MLIVPDSTYIGQYRVHSLLGEGGMGAVYYGEHVVLGRAAAIKVLLAHIARDPNLTQRFINEARIASRMEHRNIVEVYDCGLFPAPDAPDAQWYIAMEFLHGKPLTKLIEEHGGQPVDPKTILHVLAEAANGLQAVHDQHRIVHRDIKPDNLYLTQAENDPLRVKILDFGIAKLAAEANAVQTGSHMAMGTPAYAAPEQLKEAKEVDVRADVWALGVIAHEMITGSRPWGATTNVWEIATKHAALTRAPDPREFRSDTPPRIAQVISKALEPDPNRRYPNPKAFAIALAEATEMPYSRNGLALLETIAPELLRASNHSLTVGRPLPEELLAKPPEIVTARERPVSPGTISDGVPRLPERPRTVPIAAEPARTISTVSASSGQVLAPARASRSHGRMIAIGGAAVASVAIVVVLFATRGGHDDTSTPAVSKTVVADASVGARDAAAAMSALAVITNPDGAEVFVDGASKGQAPVNLQLRVGARVELRAEAPGREPATQSVTVSATPATVRLDLAPVTVPATVPPDAGATHTTPPLDQGSHGGRTSPGHKRTGHGSGQGTGSGSDFNPNDVL